MEQKDTVEFKLEISKIDPQKIKENHGSLLPIQYIIREDIKHQENREMFDYVIKQYDLWLEQMSELLFEDGYRSATLVLKQIDECLFQEPE